jgi:hypothetical protein
MLYLAAEACTKCMTPAEIAEGRTFPHIKRIREVSKRVAVAIIEEGVREGLTTKIGPKELKEGLSALVQRWVTRPTSSSIILFSYICNPLFDASICPAFDAHHDMSVVLSVWTYFNMHNIPIMYLFRSLVQENVLAELSPVDVHRQSGLDL